MRTSNICRHLYLLIILKSIYCFIQIFGVVFSDIFCVLGTPNMKKQIKYFFRTHIIYDNLNECNYVSQTYL